MRNNNIFHFKKFSVQHDQSSMKVGTDGVLLGAWVNVLGKYTLLDIGTGSGVIALMLAQRTPDHVLIDAIDLSEKDFNQAKTNFQSSPWKDKLKSYHSSLQDYKPLRKYDCIVSNPPFFSNSLEPPDVRRKTVRHTNTLTFEELLFYSIRLMKPDGSLNLILPVTEGNRFIEMAMTQGLHCNRTAYFRTRPGKPIERLLMELSFVKTIPNLSEILLYKEGNTPSEEYRSLTEDFYLNF